MRTRPPARHLPRWRCCLHAVCVLAVATLAVATLAVTAVLHNTLVTSPAQRDSFYKGRIAAAIAKVLGEMGGVMTVEDIEEHTTTFEDPISGARP